MIEPIYKKGDKTDCSNYHGISLLPASYKIVSDILLSWLSPYIVGDHQYGFPSNRSTTDEVSCIYQILEKKWEYNKTIHQLFISFKTDSDSVIKESTVQHSQSLGHP
jgi:hypothetical protein